MTNPRYCRHKSVFRITPLRRSNPFLNPRRAAQFTESLRVITELYPRASEDWRRRHAWAKARSIRVPRKRRAA